jgi:hypothetical protein
MEGTASIISPENKKDFLIELRRTQKERISKVIDLCKNIDGQIIIWVKHNDEGDILEKTLKDSVQISGTTEDSKKKDYIKRFIWEIHCYDLPPNKKLHYLKNRANRI